jgi:hypothetical protein
MAMKTKFGKGVGLLIAGVLLVGAIVLVRAIGKDIEQAENTKDDLRDEGRAFGIRFGMRAGVQEALSRAAACADDVRSVLACTRPAATFLAGAVSTAHDRQEYCKEVLAFEIVAGEPRERSRCRTFAIGAGWNVKSVRFCELLMAGVIHECEELSAAEGGPTSSPVITSPPPSAR